MRNAQESWPWDVPRSWSWTSIGDITDVVGGGTPRTDEPGYWDGGDIPWVTPADLSGYTCVRISRGARSITQAGLRASAARLLPRGTVLMSSRAPVGYVAIASQELATNQGFKSFLPTECLVAEYLYYFILGNRSLLLNLASGTTFQEISGRNAAKIPIPVPPLAEQSQIVAGIEEHLSRLDAAVAALKRAGGLIPHQRASVLKAACEGRLVPTDVELAERDRPSVETADSLVARLSAQAEALAGSAQRSALASSNGAASDALPPGWANAVLGQIGVLQGGIQKQPSRRPHRNRYPFLRVANVGRGKLDLTDVHEVELFEGELERLRLEAGDLLIVEGNGSPSEIGRLAVWKGQIPNCVHQNHLIRHRPFDGMVPEYLAIYWNSPMGSARIRDVASSSSGLYTLSVSKIAKVPVPIPPTTEQARIVGEVDREFSQLEHMQADIDAALVKAQKLRQSVLVNAFQGKLLSQDPNDEPASLLLDRIRSTRQAAAPRANRSRTRA